MEQLYALPEGAHPGRLRFTDDLESSPDRLADADTSGGSSPLYRSCSSGSDDLTPAGVSRGSSKGADATVGKKPNLPSELQQPVSSSRRPDAASAAADEPLALQGIQTSRDDRVFWVPEHGDNQPAFTEYTKQQMGSTLGQTAPAAMHGPKPHGMPAAIVSRQSLDVVQTPLGQAPTTPWAEADKSAVHQQLHQSAHALAGPWQEVDEADVGGVLGSWSGSIPTDEGPHPPGVPSPRSGVLHAISGFRGGRREDPRLRRFKDASSSVETESPPTSVAVSSTAVRSRHDGSVTNWQKSDTSIGASVSTCWSGRPQAVDDSSSARLAVGVKSVKSQLTDVEAFEAQEKQYLRAPPSLAWETLPAASESNDAGDVTWAHYCSDSEESIVA